MINLFEQLNLEYIYQAGKNQLHWLSDNYFYDFYIPQYDCIIEVNGMQHYEDGRLFSIGVKDRDKKKEFIAKDNIKNYIVIDCRKSELEYIKTSIINSDVATLFDLSKIDWKLCDEYALSNIVKSVCEYYSLYEKSTYKISKHFHLAQATIIDYLKKGNLHNWCNPPYNPDRTKPILIYYNNVLLGEYQSAKYICDNSMNILNRDRISVSYIYSLCKNGKDYYGYNFKYAD
jgi:hypothetical protein